MAKKKHWEDIKKDLFMWVIIILIFASMLAVLTGIVWMFYEIDKGYIIVMSGGISTIILLQVISATNNWVNKRVYA